MRRLITNITVLILTILISGCAKDDLTPHLPSPEGAVLRFTLPNSSLVDVGAETKTAKNDFEKKIKGIDFFLIAVTAKGEAAPTDDAEVLDHDYFTFSDGEEISVPVPVRDEPAWIVAVVNSTRPGDQVPATFGEIKAVSEDLSSLYNNAANNTQPAGYAENLPMYGQKYFAEIADATHTIDLKHICARIDVANEEANYTLESVTLLNGAKKGHYVSPSPLTEYTGEDVTQYKTTTLSDGKIPSIYLYENGGGSAGSENYTDIVIGGKYTISTGNVVDSYIKVKLEYGSPLSADIIRNNLYKLTLKSISKSNIGYKTLEDAKKGEYSDAEIDIEIGTDAMSDMVVGNGDYYMSFSNSEYRAYVPTGTKNSLTAFTLRYDKNSSSSVDMATVKKEISLGNGSTGITLVSNTSGWTTATDIDVKVSLADNANGSIIVRIGNLVKEIKVVREQNATNLPTAFNDDNYVYAKFVEDAPSWLKIATKTGKLEAKKELYSTDGFQLDFAKDIEASQTAEFYLSRSSDKGRTKVYVEQYTQRGTPVFNVSGLSNSTSISYAGANISTTFAVTGSSANVDFLDETQQSGSSYWEAEFSEDDGATWTTEKPEWIDMPINGTGALSASTIKAAAQPLVLTGESVTAQAALRAAAPKGSASSPYNLANGSTENNDSETTANSYLVGASGTYELPLVYGNAKKNGSPNSAAYSGATFVDYNGTQISDPNIKGASSTILCWQDAPNLVTGVQLSGDYLVFTVPQETIMEGNAVVAIRDGSGIVMWSWHIWVTNYTSTSDQNVYYQTSHTASSNIYSTMMNVNLGWCSPGTSQYGEYSRTVKVRLKQAGGALQPSADGVTYTQTTGGAVTSMGNNPYYQYGRKDPMLPSNGAGNTNKDQSGDDALLWKITSGQATLKKAIQNPNAMYVGSNNWCPTAYNNLWSANNTSGNTIHIADHVKTVYDPSPAGYMVPPTSYFTGFTTTGGNTSSSSQFNVSGPYDKGRNFFTQLNKHGSIIHFPASGIRNYSDGSLRSVSSNGFCWSASPGNSYLGYYLGFERALVYPLLINPRSYGFPVRPVQE